MPYFGKTVSIMCRRPFHRLDSLVVESPLRVREVKIQKKHINTNALNFRLW